MRGPEVESARGPEYLNTFQNGLGPRLAGGRQSEMVQDKKALTFIQRVRGVR